MKAIYNAGAKEITKNGIDEKDGFIYPSYVEDIMGPMLFDYGYGPFRWVCLSHDHEDLIKTDRAAMEYIDPNRRGQDRDNYIWIKDAEKNKLVVGTEARILYQSRANFQNRCVIVFSFEMELNEVPRFNLLPTIDVKSEVLTKDKIKYHQ